MRTFLRKPVKTYTRSTIRLQRDYFNGTYGTKVTMISRGVRRLSTLSLNAVPPAAYLPAGVAFERIAKVIHSFKYVAAEMIHLYPVHVEQLIENKLLCLSMAT